MNKVQIQYSPEDLAWKVIRSRSVGDGVEYLSSKGWEEKVAGETIHFDEAMLWTEEDLEALSKIFIDHKKD